MNESSVDHSRDIISRHIIRVSLPISFDLLQEILITGSQIVVGGAFRQRQESAVETDFKSVKIIGSGKAYAA